MVLDGLRVTSPLRRSKGRLDEDGGSHLVSSLMLADSREGKKSVKKQMKPSLVASSSGKDGAERLRRRKGSKDSATGMMKRQRLSKESDDGECEGGRETGFVVRKESSGVESGRGDSHLPQQIEEASLDTETHIAAADLGERKGGKECGGEGGGKGGGGRVDRVKRCLLHKGRSGVVAVRTIRRKNKKSVKTQKDTTAAVAGELEVLLGGPNVGLGLSSAWS